MPGIAGHHCLTRVAARRLVRSRSRRPILTSSTSAAASPSRAMMSRRAAAYTGAVTAGRHGPTLVFTTHDTSAASGSVRPTPTWCSSAPSDIFSAPGRRGNGHGKVISPRFRDRAAAFGARTTAACTGGGLPAPAGRLAHLAGSASPRSVRAVHCGFMQSSIQRGTAAFGVQTTLARTGSASTASMRSLDIIPTESLSIQRIPTLFTSSANRCDAAIKAACAA